MSYAVHAIRSLPRMIPSQALCNKGLIPLTSVSGLDTFHRRHFSEALVISGLAVWGSVYMLSAISLERDLQRLKSGISTLEDRVNKLENRLDKLDAKIDGLTQTLLPTLQKDKADIASEKQKLQQETAELKKLADTR